MAVVTCPVCGEADSLSGERISEAEIRVTCGVCGTGWTRSTTRQCGLCGSDQLEYTPKPLWEKGRGDQRTPAGRLDAWSCLACGAFDVTSDSPRARPPEAPSRWIRRSDIGESDSDATP